MEKKFNIFQVAGIWKSEEIHTSILAELLNPHSCFHAHGEAFLRAFVETLGLSEAIPPAQLADAVVATEVPTGENRRIDMVIAAGAFYLPFEVKIWARDQKAQLQDYLRFAETQKPCVPAVYYLTPNGRAPSSYSCGTAGDRVRCLSFQGDILPWLEQCDRPGVSPDVREILRQLHENIQRGFRRWRNDVLDEICRRLSRDYPGLQWTEASDPYETATLHKAADGPLEFALRIRKAGQNRVELHLICGLTTDDGKINYAAAGRYIHEPRHHRAFDRLLADTFVNGGETLIWDGRIDTRKNIGTWSRRERTREADQPDQLAEQCLADIQALFGGLREEVRRELLGDRAG